MSRHYTLTEAKAKLSELISRVHYKKEKFTITRKGKAVALISPITEIENDRDEEGLICAKGVLSNIAKEMDELVTAVYTNREKAMDRKVDI